MKRFPMHIAHSSKSFIAAVLASVVVLATSVRVGATPLTPLITPAGGYYKGVIYARLQCPGPAVTIRYTTDGSAPSQSNGQTYSPGSPISITASSTLKAVAYDGISTGAVATGVFQIDTGATTVPLPQFSPPAGGRYGSSSLSVGITAPGATIYYSTDGNPATTSSIPYTTPVNLSATTTLHAIAVQSGHVTSGNATADYTLNCPPPCDAPTISTTGGYPLGGSSFTGWVMVTIADSNQDAAIRYTTDGSAPTAASTQYTGPKFIGVNTVLTARAFAANCADSATTTASYTTTDGITTVSMQSYNVSTAPNADNTSAFQQAFEDIKQANGSSYKRVHLTIPTGTYQFSGGLTVPDTNNLEIDGQGSTLVFANAVNACFDVKNCNNVKLENMIIDTALPTATPATVTEVDTAGYDCLLDAGFSAGNIIGLPAILKIDPASGAPMPGGYSHNYSPSLSTTSSPPSITFLTPFKLRINSVPASTQGDYVNLRQYTYAWNAANFNQCDGVTVSNVTMYSSAGMGIHGTGCTDVSLTNVNTLVAPGSGRISSTATDGSHFTANKGLISYQDCQFQAQDDDGINVCGNYYAIQSVSGNTVTVGGGGSPPNIKAGEVIEFHKGNGLLTVGSPAVVRQVLAGPNQSNELTLTLASTPPGGLGTQTGDVIDSLTWLPNQLSITRCNFLSSAARGCWSRCLMPPCKTAISKT